MDRHENPCYGSATGVCASCRKATACLSRSSERTPTTFPPPTSYQQQPFYEKKLRPSGGQPRSISSTPPPPERRIRNQNAVLVRRRKRDQSVHRNPQNQHQRALRWYAHPNIRTHQTWAHPPRVHIGRRNRVGHYDVLLPCTPTPVYMYGDTLIDATHSNRPILHQLLQCCQTTYLDVPARIAVVATIKSLLASVDRTPPTKTQTNFSRLPSLKASTPRTMTLQRRRQMTANTTSSECCRVFPSSPITHGQNKLREPTPKTHYRRLPLDRDH